jgi:AraC-like DNA-binding protein
MHKAGMTHLLNMKQSENIFYPNSSPESFLIRFIWRVSASDFGIERETILPKGTAEIIFNLSQNTFYFKESEKSPHIVPKCSINGLNTSPHHLIKNESQTFIGIQMHAFALKYLFNIPLKEFTNQVFNGFDICGELKELFEQLSLSDSFDKQVNFILLWLKKRLILQKVPINNCILFDLHNSLDIESLSVKYICRKYNISDRHLRRLSAEYLGMNTEDFILYRKYLKSLYNIHNRNNSQTSVAYESGFYDQSHFIREFKAFTGLTPGEYRKQMGDIPGHLFFNSSNLSV